jgi:calcineurin-like phosphoesterase family protein
MSSLWFTSDTHFGHVNIVKATSNWPDKEKACRDFPSVKDHDDYLIEQINKRVKSTDTLFHLGDVGFGFAWKDRLPEMRARIKCETIHLIFGNHDHIIEHANSTDNKIITSLFKSMQYLKFGKIGGRSMVLCHYAMMTWPWQHHGSIHLFGHSHNNLKIPKEMENAKMMDVGVDTDKWGHEKYTPYEISEIFHIMDTHKSGCSLDHHNKDTN